MRMCWPWQAILEAQVRQRVAAELEALEKERSAQQRVEELEARERAVEEQRTKFVLLDGPVLSEEELAGAFAIVITDKRMRALLQVIGELERDANEGAQKAVGSHGICASQNGGAEFAGLLRDRILQLQQKGFGQLSGKAA